MNRISDEEKVINPNNQRLFPFNFQAHLYEVFINQKKYAVKTVADRMGIKADTLYAYIEDRRYLFPVDRLFDYIRATGDYAILHYLARELGFSVVSKKGIFGKMVSELSTQLDLNMDTSKKER